MVRVVHSREMEMFPGVGDHRAKADSRNGANGEEEETTNKS